MNFSGARLPGVLALILLFTAIHAGAAPKTEKVAEVLDISLATVKRDWTVARTWLARELAIR